MDRIASIKKTVSPHAGRLVTVVAEIVHPNGRQAVKLVVGKRAFDAGKWTATFGRYAQNILEYAPDELEERKGEPYSFGSLLVVKP